MSAVRNCSLKTEYRKKEESIFKEDIRGVLTEEPSVCGIYSKEKERIYPKNIYDNALYIKNDQEQLPGLPRATLCTGERQVKRIRAQGGCLGTESRRKT